MTDTSKYTEAEIISGCVKGDRLAQKALYDRYASVMYPVCVRYVGREDGKDLLQDGFLKVFDKIGTFKGEGSFEGWMRRLFINEALMRIRKADVLKRTEEIGEVPAVEIGFQDFGVLESITSRELMGLIEKMPVGLRNVFNLFVLDGYSHAEVAKILGISEVSSRSQASRARSWLQEKIIKLYGK